MDRIGRYRIVKELGRGAMGIVYLATDPTIGRNVAIKVIRLGDVSNPQERAKLRERLFREARSAGILSHKGIVTIYDMQEEDDVAYIAMEYVDGPTLDILMSESDAMPREKLLDILRQTAAALDYAHQKNIVHRDIKPANIMIDRDGTVKITDFGIAKVTTSDQFTMTGTILGTPNYMAPEQVQGIQVDGRADQFSLGVIAYEMLTGEKPFAGEHLTTVVYKIVAEEAIPPHRLNPTITPPIESVVRKALSKKPEARYTSCADMVAALGIACAGSKGWKNLPRGGGQDLPTAIEHPKVPLPPPRIREEPPPGKRVGALPVLFAILVAAGLVGLIAWQAAPYLEQPKQQAAQIQPAQTPAKTEAPAPVPPPAAAVEEPPKPSAMPQEEPAQESEPPKAQAPVPRVPEFQNIWVPTDPPGATAALDGRADSECKTPCMLQASPGRHTVAVSLPGHQTERREVTVTNSAQDFPLIKLREAAGVLMVSSTPPGAAIQLNGKPVGQTTPAQLSLAPGPYRISVEKDGRHGTATVIIGNGDTKMVRIPLEQ